MILPNRLVRVVLAFWAITLFAVAAPAQASAPSITGSGSTKGECGQRVRVTFAAPFASGRCTGVRPGAIVHSPTGDCTFAFLFKGSDRRMYMSTAGHCLLAPKFGEHTYSGDGAPGAFDGQGRPVGKFVYAAFDWPNIDGPTRDFALIKLYKGVKANPKMCYFGGPDGIYSKFEPLPQRLKFFGNSPTYRESTPARSAIARNTLDATYISAVGESAPGDSGSGIINQNGEAVGVLTGGHLLRTNVGTMQEPDIVMARLDVGVKRAEKILHRRFTIVSARVEPDTLT